MNDVDLMFGDEPAGNLPGTSLAGESNDVSRAEIPQLVGKELSQAMHDAMKERIGDKINTIPILGHRCRQFLAAPRMDNQPCFDPALSQHAKVMEWEDRFAALARRRVIRDNEYARGYHIFCHVKRSIAVYVYRRKMPTGSGFSGRETI